MVHRFCRKRHPGATLLVNFAKKSFSTPQCHENRRLISTKSEGSPAGNLLIAAQVNAMNDLD
jgi:ribosomal protein L34E